MTEPGHPQVDVVSLDAIREAVDLPSLLDEIAQGFVDYSAGRAVVPPVGHLALADPPGDVHIKYGYVLGDDVFVVKIAGGVPDNVAVGLPPGDGLMVVGDRRTGLLRAVLLDRGWLTDLRTAAAGAVAARALAPRDVRRIGILGAGVQGRLQLRLLASVTACRDALVQSRTPAHAERYAEEMAADGFRVAVAPSADALVAESDLVVTTTAAHEPLFRAESVRAGTHVTAVGADAPGKQELDPALFARADAVVVDSHSQTADHGDLAHALAAGAIGTERVVELGAVLAGAAPGRIDAGQITLCDLTGVAVQDIVIARHVLARVAGSVRRSAS